MRRERPLILCPLGDDIWSIALMNQGQIVVGLSRGVALFEVHSGSEF